MQHDEQEHGYRRGVTRMYMQGADGMQDDKKMMLRMHHQQTQWIYWTLIILGVWLLLSPASFDYGKNIIAPAGNRPLWLTDTERVSFMQWSDIISGILLIIFGWRSLLPDRPVSLWVCCFIGVWISMAPLLFWAPSAAIYFNDTLIGILVIALSILIPGMPNMLMYMKMGSEVPEGWSYNPSSWAQRWIMIATGLLGFLVSRYLASYQLGYIDHVWDPFFTGEQVLNSHMSRSLPVSDAGLGALAYTFEFLMGYMGGPARWRTMPWMVAIFGILVIPLGLVHIFLVISQPLTVGAWCTFCILAAAIMLPMIPLEIDEVIAMGQHMVQATRNGEKFWKVFWKGGKPVVQNKDERSPQQVNAKEFTGMLAASVWGMSAPATLILTALAGIAFMCLPGIYALPVKGGLSDINHLCGALVIVFSVISMAEVIRTLRWMNILPALAIIICSLLYKDVPFALKIINITGSIAIILFSIPKGSIKERYGLWQSYIH